MHELQSKSATLADLDTNGDLGEFVANHNEPPNRVWFNKHSGEPMDQPSIDCDSPTAPIIGEVTKE